MLQPYLEIGKIVGTHGVRGELRMEPWCDSPDFVSQFHTLYQKQGGAYIPVKVLSVRTHKNMVLLQLAGVDSIEQGDVLRGRILYIAREDAKLPEGRYFITDLIGIRVLDADTGQLYGRITDVMNTGSKDIYEITNEQGRKFLMPALDEIVLETDVVAEVMRIRPMKGIFDDAD